MKWNQRNKMEQSCHGVEDSIAFLGLCKLDGGNPWKDSKTKYTPGLAHGTGCASNDLVWLSQISFRLNIPTLQKRHALVISAFFCCVGRS